MKIMIIIVTFILLTGCSTSKEEMFPHSGETVMDVWSKSTGASNGQLNDGRLELRRSIDDGEMINQYAAHTRNAKNEIDSQFQRLANPDLVMYIFPHLTNNDEAPIPGYSTIFSFFYKVKYAMPGERTGDY